MAHSVTISNQIPSFEETAEFYGLSKADRKFVSGLFTPTTNSYHFSTSKTGTGMFETKRSKPRKTRSGARKAA
jgi:hypothetical protein